MEESGLTAADEMLYPENRSYLDDVLSYEAVGARSVENQQHRLTASGMDIPVGMKNPHQRRPFGDAQLHPGGPERPHLPLPGLGCVHHGQPPGPRHPAGGVDKYGTCVPNYHYEDLMRLWELYQKQGALLPGGGGRQPLQLGQEVQGAAPHCQRGAPQPQPQPGIKGPGEGRDDRAIWRRAASPLRESGPTASPTGPLPGLEGHRAPAAGNGRTGVTRR